MAGNQSGAWLSGNLLGNVVELSAVAA